MKKIDKIDGCHHCPLKRDILPSWGQSIGQKCTHYDTDGMDVTDYANHEVIHPECPLPEDT